MADRTITVSMEIDAEFEGVDDYIEKLDDAEQALNDLERASDGTDITLRATDEATDDINRVNAAIERLSVAEDPDIEIEARDDATETLDKVETSARELDQLNPELELKAEDKASTNIQKAADALEDVGEEADEAKDKLEDADRKGQGFGNMLKGAIAGLALKEIGEKIIEVVNLGTEVNNARIAFGELTTPIGDTNELLGELQRATGGAVDNLTLMNTSNMMLKTGLATNAEELVKFTDYAFALTGSAEGVENFIAALNNMSYERLDTLGISASTVRARVKELNEAGYDTQEAFKIAVLEEAEKTLDKLGEAAVAAETPLNRLATNVVNAFHNIAAGISEAVNAALAGLEQLTGASPEQQAAMEERKAEAFDFGAEYGGAFVAAASQYLSDDVFADLADNSGGTTAFAEAIKVAYDAVLADPTLLADRDRLASTLFAFGGSDVSGGLADAFLAVYNNQYAADLQRAAYEQYQAVGQFQSQIDAAKTSTLDFSGRVSGLKIESGELFDLYKANLGTLSEGISAGIDPRWDEAQLSFSEFVDAYDELASAELPEFLDPAIAEQVNEQYDNAVRKLDEMRQLADEGLISSDQLTQAQQMVDGLGEVKDAADKAAEAFKNLSLSTVFGQDTEVDMAQEILDRVMEDPRMQALGEGRVGNMQQAFDLATGTETAGSVAFDQVIIPLITQAAIDKSPEIAAAMAEAARQGLEQATLAGIDTTSAEFVDQLAASIAPMAEGGAFDVTAFVEGLTTASDKVTDISEASPDMAGDFQQMELAAKSMALQFPLIEQSFDPAQRAAETLADTLRVMASKPVTIRVNLDIADPSGLIAALGGVDALNGAMTETTRRKGGNAPGASNR